MGTPSNFHAFVLETISRMTRSKGTFDQAVLRRCLNLASSYLLTDTTTNADGGFNTWYTGLSRLVDVVAALDGRGELELETMSAASKACSECWSVAGGWRELEEARECLRRIAQRLKGLLDENGTTYRGQRIYTP